MAGIFAATNSPRSRPGPGAADPISPLVTQRPSRPPKRSSKAPMLLSLGAAAGAATVFLMMPARHVVSFPAARDVERVRPLAVVEPQQPVTVRPLPVRVPAIPFPGTATGVQSIPENSAIAPRRRPMLMAASYRPLRHPAQRRAKGMAHASNDGGPCGAMHRLWLARCMRPQVLAADRQLRQAYANAVRSGVDRDMLVSYRNRWNRMRGDAISDPRYVTVTFQQMARRLDAASDRADY